MITLIKLMLGIAGLALCLPATAEWKLSRGEVAMLPPYCAARFDDKSEAFKSWRASMGPDFIHIHHYCNGLNFLNRALGSSSTGRRDTLVAAVREFDYVLDHVRADFYLRPEVLTNRAIALTMLTRHGEAVGNLLEATRLDPRQVRAYSALADLYVKQNNRSKALDAVSEGLRHNPETRALQRRYTELGGKLPYPAPRVPATAPSEATAAGAAQAAEPAPETAAAPAPEPAQPPSDAPAPPKIGSPTNPYCRFCPD